jgi:hypothetical protein
VAPVRGGARLTGSRAPNGAHEDPAPAGRGQSAPAIVRAALTDAGSEPVFRLAGPRVSVQRCAPATRS